MEVFTSTMQAFFQKVAEYVPNLLLAVVVLIVGWALAKVVSKLVRQVMLTGDFDLRLAKLLNIEAFMGDLQKPRKRLATLFEHIVFYLLLVVVFIFFLQLVGDETINNTLAGFLTKVVDSLPAVLKAFLILAVAWFIAVVLKFVVIRVMKGMAWGERLEKALDTSDEEEPKKGKGFAESFGDVVFYLVLVFALPAFLEALGIEALMVPFRDMFSKAFSFLPNILAGGIIFVLGYMLARLCERLVTNFLLAIGINRWLESMKLESVLKALDVAKIIGTIVFLAIMIPVLGITFETLKLPMVSEVFTGIMTDVSAAVPLIIGAFILVIIGLLIGRYLGDLTTQVLKNLGFDVLLGRIGLGPKEKEKEGEEEPAKYPLSKVAGNVVHAVIVLFLAMEGFRLMRLNDIAEYIHDLLRYLPSVIIAFVILGIGFYLAGIVQELVKRGFPSDRSVEADIVGIVLRYAVIVFAFFMAFDHLGVARTVVTNAFIILLGTVGLAAALAFGLGSKEQASDYVKKIVLRGKEGSEKTED